MKNLFAFAITCLISGNIALSQVALYGFSQSTGTYTEITGGTVYGLSGGVPPLDNQVMLDPANPVGYATSAGVGLPIGFDFQFNANTFDRLAINTNGWISLGQSALTPSVHCSSQFFDQPLSSNSVYNPNILRNRISPFGCDLVGQSNCEIRMEILGSAPNRICVVQWKNYSKKNATGDNLNFQVRLHETTNTVEFMYGTMVSSTAWAAQIGLGGINNTDYNNRKTASDWNNTTAGSANNSTVSVAPGIFPVSGKKFTWTVPQPCLSTVECQLSSPVQNSCTNVMPGAISASGFGQSDIVFQWQQSSDNGVTDPWTNVTAGLYSTTPSYVPTFFNGTPMYYRLSMVPCAGASVAYYSGSVLVDNMAAPSENASNLTFSNVKKNEMQFSWSNGNGLMRYVVMNTTNSFTDPVDGPAGPAAASAIYAGGQQVVYNSGNTVQPFISITGLTCNTTYYFKIYEYQRCGTAPNYEYYYNTTGATASQITEQPSTAVMPVNNNFLGFNGVNLGSIFPGWYEAKSASAGSLPLEMSSWWQASTLLGTTAVINLSGSNTREWMISPKMEVTVPSMLSFKAALTDAGSATADLTAMTGTDDKVNVMISTGCGAPWMTLHVFDESSTTNLHNTLTTYNFDLDAYIGQTIQVAFYAVDGPVNNSPDYDFHIGDIKIMETPECLPPVDPVAVPASFTSAAISWLPPSEIPAGYEYVITTDNNPPTGAGAASATNSVIAENLVNGELYYVWVRSMCTGSSSSWSGPATVIMDYCTPFSDTVDNEGIIKVVYGTVNNISSVEAGNYGDYSSLSSNYSIDETVNVSITLATDNYNYETKIWVDWNNDLDFNDSGELVSHDTTGIADTNVINASFNVPFTTFGAHRMRIGGLDYGVLEPCFSGTYAAFEDYTLNIGCPLQIPVVQALHDSICAGETALLSVNGIGANITWFDAPLNGNIVHAGISFTTAALSTPTSYWVEQALQGCPGVSERTEVKAVIIPVKVTLNPVNVTCHGFADGSFSLETVSCGNPPFLYSVNGSAFGAIPADLPAGSYNIIARDASMNESQSMNILITHPTEVPAPQVAQSIACEGSASNMIHAYPDINLGLLPADTLVLNFNMFAVTEVNTGPGANIGIASLSALPVGSYIQSMTLSMPGTVSATGSATSDIKLGLGGAINSYGAAGTGSSSNSGSYDYTRELLNYSVNGYNNVFLRYWNTFNNLPGDDAILGDEATLTIVYQAPDLPSISWWTAPTGGTLMQSADSLETIGTGVISSPATQGLYTFFVQAEFGGCASGRSEVQVLVAANPEPAILASGTTFCPMVGLELTSSLQGVNLWSNGMQGDSITAQTTGSYTVTMTDTNGCSGTSLPITITAFPLTTVDAGPDQEICRFGSVTLSGSGATNYTWNYSVTNDVPFVPSVTRTYTVFSTDLNGCVVSDQVKVTVNPLPTVSGGPNLEICAGEEILLAGSGAVTYTWDNGVTDNIPFVPVSSNVYAVHGIDENGCANNAFVQLILRNPPVAEIQTVENGSYTTMYASPNNPGYSFQWISCDDNLPFLVDTNTTFIPYFVGSYQVAITNNFGCTDTSDCVNVNLVGLEENTADLGVTLYPNPTGGNVYVSMPASVQANITVYNAQGKIVSVMNNVQNGAVIDLKNVEMGMYMIQVANASGSDIFRVVKN